MLYQIHTFGHANILTFTNSDGSRVRKFNSVEEMDETMIENWNNVVKQNDVVYHLGDVVINKKFLPHLKRLNGSKRLIMGNHDIFDSKEYLKYFTKIMACRVFPKEMILTHIPIHRSGIERFKVVIHGHLHCNKVKIMHGDKETNFNDPMYLNVCVENTNYTPINLEEIRDKYK